MPDNANQPYLERDGQSRNGRFPAELDPSYAKIDERGTEDLLRFAADFAKHLNYFNSQTNTKDGDWQPFFSGPPDEVLSRIDGYGKHEPHLALYLAFLMLMGHVRDCVNGLTKRHLDFYYKRVLGMKEKGPVTDKVHLLFELKKNVADQVIPARTLLKAGKDAKKKELFYAVKDTVVVNRAKVRSLRSAFVDHKGTVRVAPVSNSRDGIGAPLDKENPAWSPFGNEGLSEAEIGFGFASPLLLLREGRRTVTLTLSLTGIPAGTEFDEVRADIFAVYFTGPKGWIGPKMATLLPQAGQFVITVELASDEAPVVPYNQKFHGEGFETESPMMQLLIKPGGYPLLSKAALGKTSIKVEVSESKGLSLESDLGKIDASKPFMPFGPEAEEGATFYVGHDEAFSKNPDSFSLNILWKIDKAALSDFYAKYSTKVSSNSYFKAELSADDGKSWTVGLFDKSDARDLAKIPDTANVLSPSGKRQHAERGVLIARQTNTWARKEMFKIAAMGKAMEVVAQAAGEGSKEGHVRLRLLKGFLHTEYRELYIKQIVEFSKPDAVPPLTLPTVPYTPVISSLTLDYTASTRSVDIASTSESEFLNEELEFFHVTAYGRMREHRFLKERLAASDKTVFLLPSYANEGELYIGVEGIEPQQTLALLFQLSEGSANPDKDRVPVMWSILVDNCWKSLDENDIVADTTNGLLTSGIVSLSIPEGAVDNNTALPAGYYWVRAAVVKDTDAVCNIIDVKANAALAEFVNHENDPLHLAQPLAAQSITKTVEQIAAIKSIEQPYASFGGRPVEDEVAVSTRVSERLRHKNRAVTVWDYERIVLEHFNSIYKAKCIPYTEKNGCAVPGRVTVVVVPDLKKRNAVARLQPKVDKNTLKEVKVFLSDHAGYFVEIDVENPSYEQITVAFRVSFLKELEFGHYRKVLNYEIIQFLSPWAFGVGADISFGGRMHKSQLLAFIEGRPYVDFVTCFRMYHIVEGRQSPDVEFIAASTPQAILVSSQDHAIDCVEEEQQRC
jgi:hypothetical protein